MAGSVVSVNVATPREIEWRGRRATTSIWKAPVPGRVQVGRVNLTGDEQADHRFHGGVDKAIYAYAREDYDWWGEELGDPLADGTFGENLTLAAVDVTAAVVGDRWQVGSALLEVTGPRTPCWKLGARMENVEFPVHFAAAGRPAQAQGERRARVPAADPAVRRCAAGALRGAAALVGLGRARWARPGPAATPRPREPVVELGRASPAVAQPRAPTRWGHRRAPGRAPRDRAGWTPGRRARMLLPTRAAATRRGRDRSRDAPSAGPP